MTTFKWFASFVLAATIVPALAAEPHCPGNVASVPLRLVNRHQMIVAVSINHSGPYNFLLDTGTQITMVDPSLAAELHLNTQGSAVVAGVGFHASASFAQLDLLEAGSHAVANQKVLVYDLQNLHSVDLHFRGILGEDFLEHFDMLIDNAHNLLCLDDSAAMRADVKGPHIALVAPLGRQRHAGAQVAHHRGSSIRRDAARSPEARLRHERLFPVQHLSIYAAGIITRTSLLGGGLDGAQRPVSTMPPQDLQIGSLEFPRVSFFTYADSPEGLSRTSAYDGLLTLGIFRRVFICHAHHFAVLEPW